MSGDGAPAVREPGRSRGLLERAGAEADDRQRRARAGGSPALLVGLAHEDGDRAATGQRVEVRG